MKSLAGLLKFLLLMSILLAGFLFALRNSEPTALWLVRDFAPRPLSLWILLAYACGGLSGLLLGQGVWARLRLGRKVRQLDAQLQQCRQELASLKQQAATDPGRMP